MNNGDEQELLYCSFCGKSQYEVGQLIAGPSVFACDECTEIMVGVILDEASDESAKSFAKRISNKESWKKLNHPEGVDVIFRETTFPPEFRHAGITILNNFSSLIRDKYTEENVKVSIQQDHDKIILIIESEEEDLKERIEETLETYGLVLSGKEPVERLTDDPFKIAELNQQLRIAKIQLENQRELLQIEQRHNSQ